MEKKILISDIEACGVSALGQKSHEEVKSPTGRVWTLSVHLSYDICSDQPA